MAENNHLAKVRVAGSNPVVRSKESPGRKQFREHGHFLAQGQQFDLVGGLRAQEDHGKSKDMAKSEIHESP